MNWKSWSARRAEVQESITGFADRSQRWQPLCWWGESALLATNLMNRWGRAGISRGFRLFSAPLPLCLLVQDSMEPWHIASPVVGMSLGFVWRLGPTGATCSGLFNERGASL